jgi:hypothetical protein
MEGIMRHRLKSLFNALVTAEHIQLIVFATFFSLTMVLSSLQISAAATYILQPGPTDGQDAWINNAFTHGSDYGVDNFQLRVGGWGDYYYSFIQFDLSDLSLPTENVTSAQLQLYNYGKDGTGTNVSMHVDLITSGWDESVGWYSGQPSATYLKTVPAPNLGQFYNIDITDQYNAWQAGTPNHGIRLRPTGTNHQFNEFYSSDYMDDPSLRPKLIIDTASTAPVPEPSAWLLFGSGLAGLAAWRRKRCRG